MLNLRKIEKELIEIETKIEKANFTELKELMRCCNKLANCLSKKKNSCKNIDDLLMIRNTIRTIKKVKKEIENTIQQKEEKDMNCRDYKKQKLKKEQTEIKKILESDKTNEEKTIELEEYFATIQAKINYYLAENDKLRRSKRETGNYLDTATRYDIEKQIRFNLKVIKREKIFLQECKGALIRLRPKVNKIPSKKRKVPKRVKTNNNTNYYEIMLELLKDDKYYLFIKELIKENKNFLNARSPKKGPIIFEIEDRYIKNLKLELANQKLVHESPTFFYSLLKLFLEENLDLSYGEELLFTSILSNFLKEIEKKGYKETSTIKENIYALFKKRQEVRNEKLDANRYQQELQEIALSYNSRVNLTPEYSNSIRNSESFGETFTIENTPFVYSFSYDSEYNTYFRIHVLDTTLLNEECDCIKQMKENSEETSKQVKRVLKFKQNGYYPTITYQIKIEQNGIISSFDIFESTIKIEKVYENKDFLEYRNNNTLKPFVGYIRTLANYYNLPFEKIDKTEIQNSITAVLNIELKDYFEKNDLPALYYTELEMEEREKERLHNSVCYYLGKIPLKEAHQFFRLLTDIKRSRFYSMNPLEESKIELDTRNYIGYMNLLILKSNLHNFTLLKRNMFNNDLAECEKEINNDAIFLDYFTSRKLIRSQKEKETNE